MRLRQPSREFWRSTPARVNAFFKAHAASERRADWRFGQLTAVIANQRRPKHTKPLTPADFYPTLAPERNPKARMTHEEVKDALLRVFGHSTGNQPRSR